MTMIHFSLKLCAGISRCSALCIIGCIGFLPHVSTAEPVVLTGAMVPALLGVPIQNIRAYDAFASAVTLQIDEVTLDGEYVCPDGEEPNSSDGNGVLDSQDEIVFLREECSPCGTQQFPVDSVVHDRGKTLLPVVVGDGANTAVLFLSNDAESPRCTKRYLKYNHAQQSLRTPSYYAQFALNRFHFTRAGVWDGEKSGWVDLTLELRVEILLKALWGILPIHYSEDNLVCFVKRYKVGPLRLIRRGDFHLRLGFGLRGSRASVNQICYPHIVQVPVQVHIPAPFRAFFSEAYLEMTPVLAPEGKQYRFSVPECGVAEIIGGNDPLDTIFSCQHNRSLMTVSDGKHGYGWLLRTSIANSLLGGSGIVFRRPSSRPGGVAECGYRLVIRNLPRGYYDITNWVLFPSSDFSAVAAAYRGIAAPTWVSTAKGTEQNRLTVVTGQKR